MDVQAFDPWAAHYKPIEKSFGMRNCGGEQLEGKRAGGEQEQMRGQAKALATAEGVRKRWKPGCELGINAERASGAW